SQCPDMLPVSCFSLMIGKKTSWLPGSSGCTPISSRTSSNSSPPSKKPAWKLPISSGNRAITPRGDLTYGSLAAFPSRMDPLAVPKVKIEAEKVIGCAVEERLTVVHEYF